jgi:hypothetical protein
MDELRIISVIQIISWQEVRETFSFSFLKGLGVAGDGKEAEVWLVQVL